MDGLIYYNIGLKCLARLAVSVSTAVRRFNGDITILADGNGYDECRAIANMFGVKIVYSRFDTPDGKNVALLNKTRLNEASPYENTLFIDSDTLILKDFSECFKLFDQHEFIVPQFSNWRSDGRRYRKRIAGWNGIIDDKYIADAFKEKSAVNIGFYGWRKDAKIFDNWYNITLKNRESFIPDEIACQILLPHYEHCIVGKEYNTSCKHDILTDEAKTLHFHGRKHCRIEEGKYIYHSDMWYNEYDKLKKNEFIKHIAQYDRMLCKNIASHEDINNVK